MFKYIFIITLGMTLSYSIGSSSEVDRVSQIAHVINDFNLPISRKDTKAIAKALYNAHKSPTCNVSWDTLLAVAIVESNLNKRAVGRANANGTRDYGIMQLNAETIKVVGLNKNRLLSDVDYSIGTACGLITTIKVKYSKKTPYWIGIYNAGVRLDREIVRKNAQIYHKKIHKITEIIKIKSNKVLADKE